MGRVDEGFCEYLHPYSRSWSRVSLRPEDVLGLVLWSKCFGPLLPSMARLMGMYTLYCHFTITGHGSEIERHCLPEDAAVAEMKQLASLVGPERVLWRFDPIVYTQHGGAGDTLRRMRRLSEQLEGSTRTCIISFMSPYKRQERTFAERGLRWDKPPQQQRAEVAAMIAEIAGQHGMSVAACCNADLVGAQVKKASCVDADLLRRLGAPIPARWPAGPTREGCGCDRSVDIGAYDTCAGACAYCYANQDHGLAERNNRAHDPTRPSLLPRRDADE